MKDTRQTKLIRELARGLAEALSELQDELNAAGPEEVRSNGTLRTKQGFIDRKQKQLERAHDYLEGADKTEQREALHGAMAVDTMIRHSDGDTLHRMLGTPDCIARMAALILAARRRP